jgi:hypothetical protein
LVCCLAKCFGSGRIDGSETGPHSYTKSGLSVLVIRGDALPAVHVTFVDSVARWWGCARLSTRCCSGDIILIIGGLVSLYEAITATANAPQGESLTVAPIVEQQEDDTHNQVPSSMMPPGSAELPPPPYHIAIMLPSQNDTESVQVIRDSPPPSYEKAVT